MTYSLQGYPKVFLVEPAMQRLNGKLPDHIYADGSLCLYLPGTGEWNQTKYLADTIVPWACEWLFHYEIWLATGIWRGGGVHPTRRKPARSMKSPERAGTRPSA
jgi:hypothetical protein